MGDSTLAVNQLEVDSRQLTESPAFRVLRIVPAFLIIILAACASDAIATETTAIETVTASPTTQASQTAPVVIVATSAPVPGEVNVGQASCRVGPGGAYLLHSILREGDAVEIVGVMELNENWILVHVVAQNGAGCWINTQLIEFAEGSAFGLITDPHVVLPISDYYSPLRGVATRRNGDVVTVRWDPLVLRDGDDSEQTPYLVEAWVCQNGEFVFRTYGAEGYSVKIQDEDSCSERSHGRVAGAEKNGYTSWAIIPWPG